MKINYSVLLQDRAALDIANKLDGGLLAGTEVKKKHNRVVPPLYRQRPPATDAAPDETISDGPLIPLHKLTNSSPKQGEGYGGHVSITGDRLLPGNHQNLTADKMVAAETETKKKKKPVIRMQAGKMTFTVPGREDRKKSIPGAGVGSRKKGASTGKADKKGSLSDVRQAPFKDMSVPGDNEIHGPPNGLLGASHSLPPLASQVPDVSGSHGNQATVRGNVGLPSHTGPWTQTPDYDRSKQHTETHPVLGSLWDPHDPLHLSGSGAGPGTAHNAGSTGLWQPMASPSDTAAVSTLAGLESHDELPQLSGNAAGSIMESILQEHDQNKKNSNPLDTGLLDPGTAGVPSMAAGVAPQRHMSTPVHHQTTEQPIPAYLTGATQEMHHNLAHSQNSTQGNLAGIEAKPSSGSAVIPSEPWRLPPPVDRVAASFSSVGDKHKLNKSLQAEGNLQRSEVKKRRSTPEEDLSKIMASSGFGSSTEQFGPGAQGWSTSPESLHPAFRPPVSQAHALPPGGSAASPGLWPGLWGSPRPPSDHTAHSASAGVSSTPTTPEHGLHPGMHPLTHHAQPIYHHTLPSPGTGPLDLSQGVQGPMDLTKPPSHHEQVICSPSTYSVPGTPYASQSPILPPPPPYSGNHDPARVSISSISTSAGHASSTTPKQHSPYSNTQSASHNNHQGNIAATATLPNHEMDFSRVLESLPKPDLQAPPPAVTQAQVPPPPLPSPSPNQMPNSRFQAEIQSGGQAIPVEVKNEVSDAARHAEELMERLRANTIEEVPNCTCRGPGGKSPGTIFRKIYSTILHKLTRQSP